jgi:cytoskeletal protein CcmA (bactofilin family)
MAGAGFASASSVWTWRRRPAQEPLTSFIDAGSELEGKCSFSGTLVMNGKLQGDIESTGTLIVGATAVLHARVRARAVVVHGEIVGDIIGTERIELKASAHVYGDLATPLLSVEEGAVLEGRTRMSEERRDAAVPAA